MHTVHHNLFAIAALASLALSALPAQAQIAPPTRRTTTWNSMPGYSDPADEYSFRPIFNPPAVDYIETGMTSSMGFSSFQLTSRGEVSIQCNLTPPAQFGLKSALKLNLTVGKAAYPTPQVPIPVFPETHIVSNLGYCGSGPG